MEESSVFIKAIDTSTVHRICSGQVVLNLASAVKELIENSLDAGATSIQIKLGDYGTKSIEVIDNGSGVEEVNFQALTLKHHTSKISHFEDIYKVETFGFRGEALSSLCALSEVSITTQHKSAFVGTTLKFDHRGNIVNSSKTLRKPGTTVKLQNLFCTLPVRRTEFLKNAKKEFSKMCNVLYAYGLQITGVRITCTNHVSKTKPGSTGGQGDGSKQCTVTTIMDTKGDSVESNIRSIFGLKQKQNLMKVVEKMPTESILSEFGLENKKIDFDKFRLEGYISSCAHGCGRNTSDRQFFYMNSRPMDNPKIAKLVNEVYHQYNNRQDPFVVLNIKVAHGLFDVNVTPDKRQIFIQNEKILLAILKASLLNIFQHVPSTLEMRNVGIFNIRTGLDLNRASSGSSSGGATKETFNKRKTDETDISIESLLNFKRRLIPSKPEKKPNSIAEYFQRDSATKSCDQGMVGVVELDPEVISIESDPEVFSIESDPEVFSIESDSEVISIKSDSESVSVKSDSEPVSIKSDSEPVPLKSEPEAVPIKSDSEPVPLKSDSEPVPLKSDSEAVSIKSDSEPVPLKSEPEVISIESEPEVISIESDLPNSRVHEILSASIAAVLPKMDTSPCTSKAGQSQNSVDWRKHLTETFYKRYNSIRKQRARNGRSYWDSRPDEDDDSDSDCVSIDGGLTMADKLRRKVTIVDVTLEKIRSMAIREKERTDMEAKKAIGGVKFLTKTKRRFNKKAEEEMKKIITKESFADMKIIGQFNLGFIITQLGPDLFIIDQHASDEKYNFERIRAKPILSQAMVIPQTLELTVDKEELMVQRQHVFKNNGFDFIFDENGVPTRRIKLTKVPLTKNITFGKEDVDDLLFFLEDSPENTMMRPPRMEKAYASQACRKSVMIGTALNTREMTRIVKRMGEMEQPWNCPHGRPTIRHLVRLSYK